MDLPENSAPPTASYVTEDILMDGSNSVVEGSSTCNEKAVGSHVDILSILKRAKKPIRQEGACDEAEHCEWPKPNSRFLHAVLPPPPQLPLRQVVSEAAANWVLGAAEVKGAPPDYVFGSMIAVAGSLIGNSRWSAPWGGWEEPPVIWVVLVGTPSSGKSPAMDPLLKILNERDRAERREASAALDAWKDKIELAREVEQNWKSACRSAINAGAELPARPAAAKPGGPPKYTRHVINDATVEKIAALMADQVRGSLLVRDELAGWLTGMNRYSNGGSDRPFYLEAYGGRSFAVERSAFRSASGRGGGLRLFSVGAQVPIRRAPL